MSLALRKTPDELAAMEVEHFQRIAGSRGNDESVWNDIARFIYPRHVGTFGATSFRAPGQQTMQDVLDSTGMIALSRFTSVIDSSLTPRGQTWHRLQASDPYLMKDRQVRLYFEEANKILFKYRYAPLANYCGQNQLVYKSLGAYGTGALYIDKLYGGKGIRYRNIHIGELFIDQNHQGMVDVAYRKFTLSARQAAQMWGVEKLPDDIQRALTTRPEQTFEFLHCVRPREDYDPFRVDYMGMPYASRYIALAGKKLLDEGGFQSFPYAVTRYEQADNSPYAGGSPAMDALPSLKTLKEMKKTVLKQGQRTVDPALLGPDDGVLDAFSMRPGAYNAGGVNKDGRPLVHTLPVGNIAIGKELMDDERAPIKDGFLVTLFQILVENPQMSATEVMEKAKEKGMLLSPTMGRQESEYLGPKIGRELDVLSEQGLLPEQPEALREAQGEFTITYDSPLTRNQRSSEAAGLMRTVETALNVVNITQDPSPLDHIDFDAALPEIAEIQGVPMRWMRDPRKVAEIRGSRQQDKETQTAIQAGPSAAAMVKAMNKVPSK